MKSFFKNIDINRLAGVGTIIGVDRTAGRIRCVVLRRKGSPFNRFSAGFKVIDSFTVDSEPRATIERQAESLRADLAERKLKARYAVSTVRSMGVKVVTATVPRSVDDIGAWILERTDKLLRLPVPADQIVFRFEILDRMADGTLVEITFVRKNEIDEHTAFFSKAGLDLIALGAGARDVSNAVVVSSPDLINEETEIIFDESDSACSISFLRGKRSQMQAVRRQPIAVSESDDVRRRTIVAGDAGTTGEYGTAFGSFGLAPGYALAAGLAVKGFIPEISPENFLPEAAVRSCETATVKALFQRTAIALGSVMLVLLILPILGSMVVESMSERLDEELASSSAVYAEVMSLDQRVKELESRLSGGTSSLRPTATARSLHELARLTPEGVWLERFALKRNPDGTTQISLIGNARQNEQVADFMKNLQSSGEFSKPRLVKTGSTERPNSTAIIHFEITAP